MKKFEYVFKSIFFKDDAITYRLTEKQIKEGALDKILASGITENGYILQFIRQIRDKK